MDSSSMVDLPVATIPLCCGVLCGMIENAGQRGLSAIVVTGAGGKLGVRMQSRGIDSDVDLAQALVPDCRIGVNVCSEVALAYCPFCGTHLEGVLLRNSSTILALAERQGRYRVR